MATNGSEGSVGVVNSADDKSGTGKGLEQYVVEEANEEEGEGQAAAKEGEAHTVGVETNLNEDKGNDGASQNQQEGKVFVGGISWQTTEESLQYYFQRFGEVADVVLMRDKITGNPRGFGFVRFSDPSVAERVLQEQHSIDGRHIDVKIAVPRDGPRAGGGGARQGGAGGGGAGGRGYGGNGVESHDPFKIFVGGLDQSVTDPEFRSYFEQFGVVTDSVVMYDKKTSRSRGFGFITFADSAPMMDALRSSHSLNGKPVEVKEASPREYHGGGGGMGPRGSPAGGRDFQRGGPGASGGYGVGGYPGGGYGYGGYGGYGGPGGGYGAPGGYGAGYSGGYDAGGGYGGGGYGGGDWTGMQAGWGGWQGGWGGWGGGGAGYAGGDGSSQGGPSPHQGDQTGSGYGSVSSPVGQVPSDYGRQGGGQGGYGPQGPARAQHNRADRNYRPY